MTTAPPNGVSGGTEEGFVVLDQGEPILEERRERAAQPRPCLLFFFDRTDGYARRVEGFLAQVLQRRRNHDTFRIHRIDVRERPDLAARFRVDRTPTLCVVDNRRIALRTHRPRGPRELEQLLAPWLQSSRVPPKAR